MQKHKLAVSDETELYMDAAVGAAEIVRNAQQRAFEKAGRSMLASDVISALQGITKERLS